MMATQPIPTTVGELFATATQAAANISKHRDAMAEVAAIARAKVPQLPPAEGVTK